MTVLQHGTRLVRARGIHADRRRPTARCAEEIGRGCGAAGVRATANEQTPVTQNHRTRAAARSGQVACRNPGSGRDRGQRRPQQEGDAKKSNEQEGVTQRAKLHIEPRKRQGRRRRGTQSRQKRIAAFKAVCRMNSVFSTRGVRKSSASATSNLRLTLGSAGVARNAAPEWQLEEFSWKAATLAMGRKWGVADCLYD